MAQVLPAETGLRRVIGDGDTVPDGAVDGLADADLLELYRQLVLLRTYDERSVVYHRQGRIGTYAIYWGHEAMQVGAAYALDREDWIFPSYRESAIGLLRGMAVSSILSWWRGHPAGWWNPREFNVASICVPIATQVPHAAGFAWGRRLRGDGTCTLVFFGDGAHVRGRLPRGRELRRSDARTARSLLQQQPVGDLDAARGPDGGRRRSSTRRPATGCPAFVSTAETCSPSTRRRRRP